jgi:lysophospholipase L1-like esterase
MRLKTVFAALLAAAVTIEAAAYLAGKYLQSIRVLYQPIEADFPAYLEKRDPVLGWPSRTAYGNKTFDAAGARISPAFPEPEANAAVSLYGDSFTFGMEVRPNEAWGNLLAEKIGGRVNNFGVPGYGTDQAYLRYRENVDFNSRVVILGFVSENILRNLNQYRDLLQPGEGGLGLKPRFILDAGGDLRLIPLPELKASDYPKFVDDPAAFLKHETFLSGRLSFPFVLSVAGSLGHFHIQSRLAGEPRYAPFFQPSDPANGVRLTASIAGRFASDAARRGSIPLVLMIPTIDDMAHYRRTGRWIYQPLLQELDSMKIGYLDAGPSLLESLGGRDAQEIYARGTHLNAEGNRRLAEIVYGYFKDRGLLQLPGGSR